MAFSLSLPPSRYRRPLLGSAAARAGAARPAARTRRPGGGCSSGTTCPWAWHKLRDNRHTRLAVVVVSVRMAVVVLVVVVSVGMGSDGGGVSGDGVGGHISADVGDMKWSW